MASEQRDSDGLSGAKLSSDKVSGRALIKQLFWASRPVSWINTAYPFGLAYFLLTGKLDMNFWVGVLFFLIPYNLLMYGINDVFDYESDLRNPRKGSIEGSVLAKRWHRPTLFWSFGLPIPFLAYLFSVGDIWSNLWLGFLIFTVIAYSAKYLRFKEKPFTDSLTSASHFVGPAIYSIALAGGNLIEPNTRNILLAFTLWGMASHAFGAVQDIRADREANIRSIATMMGASYTTRFAFACYTLAGLLLAATSFPINLAAIAVVPYLVITAPFVNLSDLDCEKANQGWRRFIWLNFFAGFVVTIITIVTVLL